MKTLAIALFLVAASYTYAKPASNRIVGGDDAVLHEFPYQVSFQYHVPNSTVVKHFCGGTILNNNFVLTAAHCNLGDDNLPNIEVIAGAHDFLNKNGFEQKSYLTKFVNHHGFKGDVSPDDIAVVKLATPFKFNEKVKAANLPEKTLNATGLAIVSGWGFISDDYSNISPDVLQKAVLKIFTDTQCKTLWNDPTYQDTNLCAGHLKPRPTACKGDSGGPLVQKLNNKTTVVGVVSWGNYPCRAIKKPTVFVEVSHYIDWIKEKLSSL